MHRTLTSLGVALALTANSGGATSSAAPTTPSQAAVAAAPVIVALGDSLTAGQGVKPDEAYPAVLNQMIREAGLPFSVVNHGVSGDTTAGGVRRLPAALAEQPSILIVALGANDGLRGVPVPQVRRNLETILEAAEARDIAVLLCGMDALPVNGWQYTLDFHNIFPDLAARFHASLVPFLLDGVFLNERLLQRDLAHPNAAGQLQLARNIWPYLRELMMEVGSGQSAVSSR